MPSHIVFPAGAPSGARRPDDPPAAPHDGGASPVVGFVLVLGIALTAMTIVFLWGAPTLDSVQSSQTAAAADREFNSLSREVETLLAGAPAATTPIWSPTLTRGAITVTNEPRVWAAGFNAGPTTVFEWGDVSDGDNDLQFHQLNPGGSDVLVRVDAVNFSGPDTNQLYVRIGAADCDAATSVPASTVTTVEVFADSICGDEKDIRNDTILFTFTENGGTGNAQLLVVDASAVAWDLRAPDFHYRQEFQNGAVLSGQAEGGPSRNRP